LAKLQTLINVTATIYKAKQNQLWN